MANKVNIEIYAKNIIVRKMENENIPKAAISRANNSCFYFTHRGSLASSEEWISSHRENPDDTLLEICMRDTGTFVGTIGFIRKNNSVEIGRLSLYLQNLRSIVESGRIISDMIPEACRALLYFIFKQYKPQEVFCEILQNNSYSNQLCQRLSGEFLCKAETGNHIGDEGCMPIYTYRINREEYERRFAHEEVSFLFT